MLTKWQGLFCLVYVILTTQPLHAKLLFCFADHWAERSEHSCFHLNELCNQTTGRIIKRPDLLGPLCVKSVWEALAELEGFTLRDHTVLISKTADCYKSYYNEVSQTTFVKDLPSCRSQLDYIEVVFHEISHGIINDRAYYCNKFGEIGVTVQLGLGLLKHGDHHSTENDPSSKTASGFAFHEGFGYFLARRLIRKTRKDFQGQSTRSDWSEELAYENQSLISTNVDYNELLTQIAFLELEKKHPIKKILEAVCFPYGFSYTQVKEKLESNGTCREDYFSMPF